MKFSQVLFCLTSFVLPIQGRAKAAIVIKRFDVAELRRQARRVAHHNFLLTTRQVTSLALSEETASQNRTCEVLRQEVIDGVFDSASEEEKHEINEEEEQKIIAEMIAQDPSLTLWDIFMLRVHEVGEKLKHMHNKGIYIMHRTADYVTSFCGWIFKTIVDILKGFSDLIIHPKKGWKGIKAFFKKLGAGLKALWHMLWHNPLKYSLEQIGGGILLEVTDQPDKFAAQTILLVGIGFGIIDGVMHGLEALLPALPLAVGVSMKSALIFAHAIDDPVIILSSILPLAAQATAAIDNNHKNNITSVTLTIPKGLTAQDPIPTWPTCKLPPTSPAFKLTYGRLCGVNRRGLLELMFGVTNANLTLLTKPQVVEAQKKFHDWVCCYGPQKYTPPGLENSPVWNNSKVIIKDCKETLGTYDQHAGHSGSLF